jgi:hypothetical protein
VAEETWHVARLIPTSGINGAEEQERRATSALLAVVSAVREFGRAILGPLGAPAGLYETYIEVPFADGDKNVYPDGLIRTRRGERTWTALVEVKTGTNELKADQLEAYLDVAKEQGFNAVITISNQIPPTPGQHPTAIDRRKLRRVGLHQLSWVQVLSTAVLQKEHRGVADPDQAWILGELIRYLEHPRSGAMAFEDMGSSWVSVREAVRAGTLRVHDKGVPDVAARFDALLRYVGLRLGRRLGADVQLVLSRREVSEPALRSDALVQSLTSNGILAGAIRIPDAAATLHVTADLRANQIACHCDIDAPRQGRSRTRVNWLVRQLKDSPGALRVEAFVAHGRGASTAELLHTIRETPDPLIGDGTKDLRSFRITQMTAMGTKRGTGRGSFIDSIVDAVDTFYADVLQNLRAWRPAAPQLREEPESPDIPPALVSTALSSQDEPDRTQPSTPTPSQKPDRPPTDTDTASV